jgi:hypothetical protein
MKKIKTRYNFRFSLVITFVVALLAANLAGLQQVFAGTLTQSSVMEYNMATSGQGNIAIAFKTASAGATSVSLNFSSITTAGGSLTSTGAAVTSNATCQGLFPGTSTMTVSAPTVSSPTVSFTVTALSTTTYYCAIFTATGGLVTNPATAAAYSIPLTVGSDSQTDGIDVISSDQYTITGTVPSSFTMSLSGASNAFTGNLSSTTYTTTSGLTVAINTNSTSGWLLWAADANTGLHSATTSQTIASVATGSNANMVTNQGTNAYALGVTSVTSGTATTNYADAGGSTGGGLTPAATGFNEIASDSSSSSSTNNVVLKEIADIAATTQAANDYTDTITVVGAGSF